MKLAYDLYCPSTTVNSAEYVCSKVSCEKICTSKELMKFQFRATQHHLWDRWDPHWRHYPWRSRSVHGSRYCWWAMLDTEYGKIYWTNLRDWIWITLYGNWIGYYVVFCCVLLLFAMFSHFVLTSDFIIFFNDLQMAFTVLEFSNLVCQHLLSHMEKGGGQLLANGDMGVGGLNIAIFAVTSFLNDPV